jgi:drug/metabolite transporter (DMT)-like permease
VAQRTVQTIPLSGCLLLLLVCSLWGGNMVSIKISDQGIPPCLAATGRSAVAALCVFLYTRLNRRRVWLAGRDLWHGVVIGVLFGLDFLFLYWGTAFTHASRAVIFLYTHPFWVAVGAHLLIAHDRLTPAKGGGLLLAFAGLLLVFGSRSPQLNPNHWIGDLMEVVAALFWAATTIYIKRTLSSRPISHFQTLFAQLLFSIPVLAAASYFLEGGRHLELNTAVAAAFGYQSLVVAFISYQVWFWMIHRFAVSRLAAFTFLVPFFGVSFSGIVLGESLPLLLWGGFFLVATGIYIVNRPERTV